VEGRPCGILVHGQEQFSVYIHCYLGNVLSSEEHVFVHPSMQVDASAFARTPHCPPHTHKPNPNLNPNPNPNLNPKPNPNLNPNPPTRALQTSTTSSSLIKSSL
jgi:hypothetical protein